MFPRDLTPQEKLFIKRRRLGLSQAYMAGDLGVSYAKYRCWERGEFTKNDTVPVIELGPKLARREVCTIIRRRMGVKQWEIAKALKVKTPLVTMMERGVVDCHRLVNYWELRNGEETERTNAG